MHHSTSWWVSGLISSRMVGSSATSRPSAADILSSSAFERATIATGSSGSGIGHGSISSGSSRDDSVSPVSAVASLATAQTDPARHSASGRCSLPSGEVSAPMRSSSSWSGCPRAARPCPETCTDISARSVPENTRTSEIRPT
jgi:hypothetical protein